MIFGKQKNARPRRTGQIGTNAMGKVSAPRRRRNQNFDLNANIRSISSEVITLPSKCSDGRPAADAALR
jgi:hypothetical protein